MLAEAAAGGIETINAKPKAKAKAATGPRRKQSTPKAAKARTDAKAAGSLA